MTEERTPRRKKVYKDWPVVDKLNTAYSVLRQLKQDIICEAKK